MSSSGDYRFGHSASVRGADALPCKNDVLQKNCTSVGSAEHTLGSELPTRVALFVPSLGGGGAERVMVTLANALAERRFAVDFVLWADSGPLRSLLSEKVHVISLATHNPVGLVFGFARFLKTYRQAGSCDLGTVCCEYHCLTCKGCVPFPNAPDSNRARCHRQLSVE